MAHMNDDELINRTLQVVKSDVYIDSRMNLASNNNRGAVQHQAVSSTATGTTVLNNSAYQSSGSFPSQFLLSQPLHQPQQPPRQSHQPLQQHKQRHRRINADSGRDKPRHGKQAGLNSETVVHELVTMSPCCNQHCCRQFANQQQLILGLRHQNAELTEQSVTEWAGGLLRKAIYAARHGAPVTQYIINNICVCRTAWRLLHGLTDYKLRRALEFANSEIKHVLRAAPQPNESAQVSAVVRHMQQWLNRNAEQLVQGTYWSLPAYLSIRMLWEDIRSGWFDSKSVDPPTPEPPSMELIRWVLHKDFHGRIIQPKKGQWGLCSLCAKLNVQRLAPDVTQTALQAIEKQRDDHKRDHKAERKQQAAEQARVAAEPWNRDMVLIDLTNAAHFPHIRPTNSTTKRTEKLDLRVGGLLSYGTNWRFLFGSFANVQKGANLIITMLFFYMMAVKSSSLAAATARTFTLYVDGGSENANRFVLAFLSLMVALGWYDEIFVSRLVVGHTHSAIDQLFKAWSAMKSLNSFYDLAQFLERTRNAYVNDTKRPQFVLVQDVLDWETWLSSFLPELHHHNKPLRIWIKKDVSGAVGFLYKMRSSDIKWLGERDLKNIPTDKPLLALKSIPTSTVPSWLRNPVVIPKDVVSGVTKCMEFIKTTGSCAWLQKALQGELGVQLVSPNPRSGLVGAQGTITVGGLTESLRVITSVGMPKDFLTPTAPKPSSPSTSSIADSKDVKEQTMSDVPKFAVTNKPLPKKSRQSKKRKRDGDNEGDSDSDEQCMSLEPDTSKRQRSDPEASRSEYKSATADTLTSLVTQSKSQVPGTERKSSLRSSDTMTDDEDTAEDRSDLADQEDYVAFLTEKSTHPHGLPFSVGVVVEDQKTYESPVHVRLLQTTDKQPWGIYTVKKPEHQMTVPSESIITIFTELSGKGRIPTRIKKAILKNLDVVAAAAQSQQATQAKAQKPTVK